MTSPEPYCWVCKYGQVTCNCPAHPDEHLDEVLTPYGPQRAIPLPDSKGRTGQPYPWPGIA